MASWEQVKEIALALPGASERSTRGHLQWRVGERLFVWERPLRPKEAQELGSAAPDGPILGARVEHLGAKAALLAAEPDIYFTTSHFEHSPIVLVLLERIDLEELGETIAEAWLTRASRKAAEAYLQSLSERHRGGESSARS
jgi:hypothetical protein